ncbi:hypothetical protein [Azomonas macrocytogenes]|uniref:DUF1845 domain-containing protein n=1 Tax=Azomonas macrocytogenes TaxID=69962 RepID=A0A839TAI6_AZOMA|nr:hypothetical protein [Azomonas macrocytogenes]MBB3105164.1 hypothetical protein [Azomonas macrocytogenes]
MENIEAEKPVNPARQELSRPVFTQKLTVNSLQAQRVVERSFSRVSRSLFSLEVILRIIGRKDAIDEVEKVITSSIKTVADDLDKTQTQLKTIMDSNGIDSVPAYTNPQIVEFEIFSPKTVQFIRLITKLDTLMGYVDTLWMNSELDNVQRATLTYEWQQRLNRLAARIIGIEKHARIAAYKEGKQQEVDAQAPAQTEDVELDEASEAGDTPLATLHAETEA